MGWLRQWQSKMTFQLVLKKHVLLFFVVERAARPPAPPPTSGRVRAEDGEQHVSGGV